MQTLEQQVSDLYDLWLVKHSLAVKQLMVLTDCSFKDAINAFQQHEVSHFLPERQRSQLEKAAPDLLAALKAVVSVADRATVEFDMARAAIAKAERKEPPDATP